MFLTRSIAEKVVEKKNILFSYAGCKRQEGWGELRSCSFGILNKTKEKFHFHPESEIRKLLLSPLKAWTKDSTSAKFRNLLEL